MIGIPPGDQGAVRLHRHQSQLGGTDVGHLAQEPSPMNIILIHIVYMYKLDDSKKNYSNPGPSNIHYFLLDLPSCSFQSSARSARFQSFLRARFSLLARFWLGASIRLCNSIYGALELQRKAVTMTMYHAPSRNEGRLRTALEQHITMRMS